MSARSCLFALAALAATVTAAPALAQDPEIINRGTPRTPNDMSSPEAAAFQAGRDNGNFNREYLDHAAKTHGPPRSPAAIEADARGLVAATGLACQTTATAQLGETRRRQEIYEVDCAMGPGFILVEGSPPQAYDCLQLSAEAARRRAEDPGADVGSQCALPGNAETAIYAEFARSAGLACTVDGGVWIGRPATGGDTYEIGCADADGAWVDVAPDGSARLSAECLEVVSAGQSCRLTTGPEQAAGLHARLTGTPLAECRPQAARYVGGNASGRFYEVKCADGQGAMARFDAAGAFARSYPCAEAGQIGDGCKL